MLIFITTRTSVNVADKLCRNLTFNKVSSAKAVSDSVLPKTPNVFSFSYRYGVIIVKQPLVYCQPPHTQPAHRLD